ncbi:glycosyltransferase family 1 protein [Coleofasciculus sp. FACHB-712]|uniref:glycosyltransferase family 1 protein n=1 Tax=Coleofasciculus sp. FACHB-712 TaxID=2692789 RepID=UPI001689D122|nr:glycosyltransferase family 1 protein [Coleofasciculus sp. FACHB-712]MBD1945589.1 glycosyltransferase family 1 protein [Coleofasciculus sp. FACHB-712]
MKIVQIVPRLPPYTDGVGDYSIRLASQLLKGHGIVTQFLVFQPDIEIEPIIEGFAATVIPAHTPKALLSVLPGNIEGIILHYSNYPYIQGKIDAPFWLPTALATAVRQRNIKLIVMFHELPFFKFKKLNFLNPIQSLVSRRLVKVATTVLTDSARFQAILSRWLKQPVTCIPDFSTIGEPDERIPPLSDRSRRIIVFGGSDRSRVYQNHLKALLYSCHALGIEEICDIGKSLNLQPSNFPGVRLVQMGFQPAEAVRQLLLNSLAGFIDYSRFPGDLGKSSVFAAFCAHGLVPICSCYNPSEADGLEMHKHYLVPNPSLKNLSLTQLQTVVNNSSTWYENHNIVQNTKVFASYLSK